MDYFFEHQYFKMMRFLMISIGNWPYDHSNWKKFARFLACLSYCICWIGQIRKLIAYKNDYSRFMDVFTPVMISLICFSKYTASWIQEDKLKEILTHMREDWFLIITEAEAKILHKYTNYGRLFEIYYLSSNYAGVPAVILLQLIPAILDQLMPLDEPRPRRQLFELDLFLDEEKYYYLILTIIVYFMLMGFTTSGASDICYICVMLHASGMYSVLSYRLEHLFDEYVNYNEPEYRKIEILKLSKKVRETVQFHCRILKFVRMLSTCYRAAFVTEVLLIVGLMSGVLLRLCDAVTVHKNINDSMISTIHITSLFFLVFLNILPGQLLINKSEEVFYKAYNSRWLMAPWYIQKSLMMIMHNNIKPQGLSAYSVVTISFELFDMILQSSLSYFMVLYSMNQ